MAELARWRLARASRDWFSDTELSFSADAYVRYLNERGYSARKRPKLAVLTGVGGMCPLADWWMLREMWGGYYWSVRGQSLV